MPFDYLKNGEYAGISGAVWNEMADLIGIQSVYVTGDFSQLYNQLLKGRIHVLNVAKTDGRENKMYFPMPYLNERDRIYGKIDTPSVFDIAGLKGKTVAVIPDYYQADMLEKNLTGAKLVYFESLEMCIKAVHSGKAEYMIENPQVMSYYMGEIGIYDLVEKGITTTDTRLYFGVSLNQPELASIMNKVIPILDRAKDLESGLQSVPRRKNIEKYTTLLEIIIALLLLLLVIGWVLTYLFRQLVREKTEKELLASRETILYTDRLTGLYNRNYYNDRIRPVMDDREYPQAIIVFDLNNLKEVNDNYGHHVGDQLLEAFGEGLVKAAPGSQGVRLGGDEFVLFLHGESAMVPDEVIKTMEQISMEEPVPVTDGHGIRYSFAKGFSIREHKGISLNDMFREADQKMYADKNYRKNKPGNNKLGG